MEEGAETMTPKEFLNQISNIKEPTVITLKPGPISLTVNLSDGMAARLIMWLMENMPEDTTEGQMENVIDAAKWWLVFWASAVEVKDVPL
jgi:hypothetical protein